VLLNFNAMNTSLFCVLQKIVLMIVFSTILGM
jgi:hypothetical protein